MLRIHVRCSDTEVGELGGGGEREERFSPVFSGGSQDAMPAISVSSTRRETKGSRRVGEGRTETTALNLAQCDIPEENNTASLFSFCWWRTTVRADGGGG